MVRRSALAVACLGMFSGVAHAGDTAITGRILRADGAPLPNIRLSDGRFANATTDDQGNFILVHVPSGKSVMRIDGRHGGAEGATDYGTYEVQVTAWPGRVTPLPFISWLTKIDHAHDVVMDSPTARDMVVRSPLLPGVELRIPAGTVLTDWDGKRVNRVSLTPVDVEHPPFPLPPEVRFSSYFTAQPGGTRLWTLSGGRAAATVIYPNHGVGLPGAHSTFWHYHPQTVGWLPYGTATVSADGNSLVPEPGATLYDFMGGGNPTDPSNSQNPNSTNQAQGSANNASAGDPVDLASGLFSRSVTDLAIADVIPISVSRSYISSDATYRDFGLGMSLSYEMFGSLLGTTRNGQANEEFAQWQLNTPSSTIQFNNITPAYGDYSDALFVANTQPGPFLGARAQWTGNGFSVTQKDGSVMAFGYHAPLTYMQDRFGNRVSLTYQQVNPTDALSNRPVKITSPNGRFFSFTWTDLYPGGVNKGQKSPSKGDLYVITAVTDNLGRRTTYGYDACGRLITVQDASAIANGTGAVSLYGWSSPQPALGAGACLRVVGTPPLNLLQSVTDQNGNLAVYTLYQWGGGPHGVGATCETYLGGVAPAHFMTGRVCKQYLANPNLASGASGQTSVGSGNPLYTYAYTIDPNENILTTTVTQPTVNLVNPAAHTHVVNFTVPGDVCSGTSCSVVAPAFTTGYPVSETFAADVPSLAQTWTYTRDPVTQTLLTSTAPVLTEEGESHGRVTAFCYDNTPAGSASPATRLWNLTSVVHNLSAGGNACPSSVQTGSVTQNATTLFSYSPIYKELTSLIDPNGNTTVFCRNAGQAGCSGIGADPFELLLQVIDPDGNTASTSYAPNGQPVASAQVASASVTLKTSSVYDHADLVTTNAIGSGSAVRSSRAYGDAVGRPIGKTDPLGNAGATTYDPLYGVLTNTDPNGTYLAAQYAADGVTVSVTHPKGTIQFAYNAALLRSAQTDPLGAQSFQYYDQSYNIACRIDRNGNQANFTYDALNRLVSAIYYVGGTANCSGTPGTIESSVTYGYDHANRTLSIADSKGGTVTRQFDDLDRMTSETQTPSGSRAPIGTVSYTYDLGGRVTAMQPTGQAGEGFVYDAAGRLVAITSTGTATAVCFVYDKAGRRTALVYPQAATANNSYDAFNDLLQIAYTGAGSYTPGANGAPGTCTPGTATGATTGTLTYQYDQDWRQVARGNASQGASFTGFTLQLPPGFAAGTVAYNADDQQTLWNGLHNLYDSNGNLTCLGSSSASACSGTGSQSFAYDTRNRLVNAAAAPGVTGASAETYVYDPLSRRQSVTVASSTPSTATSFYDGPNTVSVTTVSNASGATLDTSTLLVGLKLDERFALTSSAQGGGAQDFITDTAGSVVELLQGSSNLAGYAYPAFGSTGGTVSRNAFRYTGREASDNTQLYYLRGRYYAPALSRFIQEDPLGLLAGPNIYAYGMDDPLNWIDPSGLSRQAGPSLWSMAAGAGVFVLGNLAIGAAEFFSGGADTPLVPAEEAGVLGLAASVEGGSTAIAAGETAAATAEGGSTIAANAAQGRAFEQAGLDYLGGNSSNVASQVTVTPFADEAGTAAGYNVRLDALATDSEGGVNLYDFKSSATAGFTPNQTTGYPLLEQFGGRVVGNNGGAAYPAGTILPPSPVQILRPGSF